jgi:hypothetical protein
MTCPIRNDIDHHESSEVYTFALDGVEERQALFARFL